MMAMAFPLFLANKYLKPKRSITSVVTILTVLGVVLGVAIVIIVRAVMTGFGDMWREKILAFKPHVTISSSSGGVIRDDIALAEAVRNVQGVTAVSPSVEARVLIESHHRVEAPVIIGVNADDLAALHPKLTENIVQGTAKGLDDDQVLVGVDLARGLGLRVGDKMRVYSPMNLVSGDEVFFPEEVSIGGIFQMGQGSYDSGFVITSIAFARDLMDLTGGAYSLHVKTDAPEDPARFQQTVHELRRLLFPVYDVRTWQEVDREIFNALAVEKNMMMILLLFVSVVAMFCITIALILITVQKTNEIGLLKALGFSPGQIMRTFVLYGWIQCFAGTVLGVGAAFLVLHNLQRMVDGLARLGVEVFPKSVYGLDQIPWRVESGEVAMVAVFVVALCTLASYIPAWLAARKDPVEALRG